MTRWWIVETEVMASEEHKDLANFIKNVHKELRLEAQRCEAGPEVAWEKHLERTETLQAYAGAMRSLATLHWTDDSNSRILWVHKHIQNYYFRDGIQSEHTRDRKFAKRHGEIIPEVTPDVIGKVRVLDVGSCYNPFSVFEELGLFSIFGYLELNLIN